MLIIQGNQAQQHKKEMEDAFQFRHKIFVEEMGWEDIRRPDFRETDQFDTNDAVHMLIYREDELVGYQRMLPTTKPHLLSEIYPTLCEDVLPCNQDTWEWTRFGVAKDCRKGGRKLSYIGNLLLSGIVEWGLECNVNSIVIEMNPVWLLRLVQLKFRVYPLGYSKQIGGSETLAVRAMFNQQTLAQLQEFRGDDKKVIPKLTKQSA